MTSLLAYARQAWPAARTAFHLNRMAARAALSGLRRPVRRPRPHTRSYDLIVDIIASSIPPLHGSPEPMREALDALTAFAAYSHPRSVATETVLAGGVPGLWVRPPVGSSRDPHDDPSVATTILYLHGGGYVCGSPRTHLGLLARLAALANVQVLALDYRRAPEAPFPAAVVDAWAAYWWLLEQGVAPESIFLAGDSAGGGLSVALMVALRDAGVPLPTGALLFSPWVDLALRGQTIHENARRDYLNERWLRDCATMYLDGADVTNPLASPLYADLHGLPPLLIQVGTAEMLFDDSTRLAQRASASGTPVELELWENMVHVWQMLEGIEPNAGTAIHRAVHFIRRHDRPRAPAEAAGER